MLKHIVNSHAGQDMSEVKFGMRIVEHARSSFERQIKEFVRIESESKKHEILNSKSEFNRCSLPRLSAHMGDSDIRKWKQELLEEKKE